MDTLAPSPGPSARTLRLAALAAALAFGGGAWLLAGAIGFRGQAAAGALCFIALVAACSPDLRRVNWRTVLWGMALQLGFALFILKFEVGGTRPGYDFFAAIARAISRTISCSTPK